MKCRNRFSGNDGLRWAWTNEPSDEQPRKGVDNLLNYLHEAAGFAIAIKPNVPLERTLPRQTALPENEEQALRELTQVVGDIGCTVLRKGRLLTIITAQEAKKQCIPLPRIGGLA